MKSLLVFTMGLLLPLCVQAQWESNDTPLGDIARVMRRSNVLPTKPVIDNDNFAQFMDEIETRRLGGGLRFTFANLGKTLQVTGPEVTCSLSFNAQAASLLSDPFVSRTLPESELARLEGPATIEGDNLQVAVFNGSAWEVREITVGLTLVRKERTGPAQSGSPRLLPAAVETSVPALKHSDTTVLYHMKGAASPSSNTLFQAPLGLTIAPDLEWHWAIVEAKGIPPKAN